MTGTFLPGTLRQRLIELMDYVGFSQAEMAHCLNISESAFSRFLSGKTNTFSQEKLIAVANIFHVSTDFLLGLSNNPKRGNVELQDLGLSSLALSNLLNHRFNKTGLNAFLENPMYSESFAQVVECANRQAGLRAAGYTDLDGFGLNEFGRMGLPTGVNE